jgi:GT2 family glycosyltransferase
MVEAHVTTVVVNWRLKDETAQCLESLAELDLGCRTIVIDNGSNDGSSAYLARRFPQADLVTLASNVGFGAACNLAIGRALQDPSCEYVFLLNNDSVVDPRALSELVGAAMAHPQAGILGAKVYYWDVPQVLWYAGARRRWGVLAAAVQGRDQVDRGQFDTMREVDYVFGTAMLIRRSVFERIGLFDERFFLYLEDLDFCLRAQRAGFSLLFVPGAHVWHKVSASTAHNKGMRSYHKAKSTLHFLIKHTALASSLPVCVFWILVCVRTILVDLATGDLDAVRSIWSGLTDGLAEVRAT